MSQCPAHQPMMVRRLDMMLPVTDELLSDLEAMGDELAWIHQRPPDIAEAGVSVSRPHEEAPEL